MKKRIVVGITGASGVIYGIRLLEVLREQAEVHLVVTDEGWRVIDSETGRDRSTIRDLAEHSHENHDFLSPLASGTYRTDGMVIVPCSIRCLSAVANSYSDTLLVRAADVTLKQRRPLVLGVRETPLHAGHLALMVRAQTSGAVIAPPVPAFYNHPQSIEDLINHYVFSILDIFDIDDSRFRRWGTAALE